MVKCLKIVGGREEEGISKNEKQIEQNYCIYLVASLVARNHSCSQGSKENNCQANIRRKEIKGSGKHRGII